MTKYARLMWGFVNACEEAELCGSLKMTSWTMWLLMTVEDCRVQRDG